MAEGGIANSKKSLTLEDSEQDPSPGERVDRTVVLIGRTGNGKSALANIIAGKAGVFPESQSAASETRDIHSRSVAVRYCGKRHVVKIVDTIGLGDTELPKEEVYRRLAVLADVCREGLNQILYVTQGRFDDVEKDAFSIMQSVLFGPKIVAFSTVVQTKCDDYDNAALNEKNIADIKRLAAPLMNEIPDTKFIAVNNPPILGSNEGYAKSCRLRTRQLLLFHIMEKCSEVFNPDSLVKVNERVKERIAEDNKMEIIEQQLKKFIEKNEELEKQKQKEAAEAKRLQEEMVKTASDLADSERKRKEEAERQLDAARKQQEDTMKAFQAQLSSYETKMASNAAMQAEIHGLRNQVSLMQQRAAQPVQVVRRSSDDRSSALLTQSLLSIGSIREREQADRIAAMQQEMQRKNEKIRMLEEPTCSIM